MFFGLAYLKVYLLHSDGNSPPTKAFADKKNIPQTKQQRNWFWESFMEGEGGLEGGGVILN